jgi:protoporphyrinogen oxidase
VATAHPTRSADLVVLGAGPAGLGAALWAARSGRSVVVLERAARVGGMAGSFEVAGVRVDHGSHRLHPATPPHLLAELRGLLGDDLQLRSRNGRLRVFDRWVSFPLRPAELARTLPAGALARIALDAAAQPLRQVCRGTGDTYAGVLRRGLGPTLFDGLYAPYAAKLWGLPPEQVAGEQARRRVSADSPWRIAARALRAGGSGQGRVFHYPRRGFGQIVEALAQAAADAGADIRCGVQVRGVDLAGADPVVSTSDGGLVGAGHVLSTIPLTALARIASPAPPAEVLAGAARLRFRAMVLVYLVHAAAGGVHGGRWTGYDAHYLPGPHTPVSRVSEPANYRDSDEDPPDRTVLCAEVPCDVGDAVWTSGDDDLAALVTDGLVRSGLPRPNVTAVEVRRLPHAYPVYDLGHARNLSGLDAWAASLPRLTTFGRQGLFAHDNTHHALAMAWDAVGALTGGGRRDEAAWAAARRRFANHVVED